MDYQTRVKTKLYLKSQTLGITLFRHPHTHVPPLSHTCTHIYIQTYIQMDSYSFIATKLGCIENKATIITYCYVHNYIDMYMCLNYGDARYARCILSKLNKYY